MANRLVFFGNERLATGVTTTAPTLQALAAAGYQIVAVVVAQNEGQSSRQARQLEIAQVAAQLDIPVLQPTKLTDIQDQLEDLKADIGVLAAYGKLVPEEIINIFPVGIVNIHPSLLPKHRGSAPIESVILEGAKETGVSLMKLVKEMDAGPVYAQEVIPLDGKETKQALSDSLLNTGKDLLIKHLPAILDGSLPGEAQDETNATYDERITKEVSSLDPTKPAAELERAVRAYAGWPRSRIQLGTTEVIVTQAHVSEISGTPGTLWLADRQLGVHCQAGTLVIDALIPPGKPEMPAAAFLAGYQL